MNCGLLVSNLISLIVRSPSIWQPMTTRCCFMVALLSVEIEKKFLNSASCVGIGSVKIRSCAWVMGLTTTRDELYLISSTRKLCMAVHGLNFVLARGGGKYTRIVKEWVLSAGIFCSTVALSHLDLDRRATFLNEESASSEDTMVVLADLVISLREGT